MVVTTVLAKKNDCPKLQEGTLVPFAKMETPRLLASTMSSMNSSRSASEIELRAFYAVALLAKGCDYLAHYEKTRQIF